jgi:electron transport complex protein RnfB
VEAEPLYAKKVAMATEVYHRLARHLDKLPGGFPPTEDGVELRILRRLFTPEEAELALHLTLLEEEPRVIARRAKIPVAEAARRLEEMALKGLIYRSQRQDGSARYMVSQYVIGIWEFQVNNLSPELIRDMETYLPTLFNLDAWRAVPQLRTIPVGESISPQIEVLPYEWAEALVRAQERILVAPCICRRERRMVGEGCDKPEETCLVFGIAADYYLHNGLGRTIDQEEALSILKQADEAGLVLQPGNAKEVLNICCCCGCCCGILRGIKHLPQPASLVSSPFVAVADPDVCTGCGLCLDRCQMEALALVDGRVALDLDRCIGCGLCVTTCPSGALRLTRKPEADQPAVPRDITDTFLRLARVQGKLSIVDMVTMLLKSRVDRLLAPR